MSDNTAGRCQARRPGRLLEATCKRCPRGMAVTYRLPKAGGALQNPAYRPADVLQMRGSARPRRTPRQFWQTNAMTREWHIDVTTSLMTGGSRVAPASVLHDGF